MILLALSVAAASPQDVSLDQLRASPHKYAGRSVELAGQLDECWGFTCHLCPLDSTPSRPQWQHCLSIDFDRFRGGETNRGADMDSAFRYADVVVTARFDPSCLTGICTDRASVLLDARVSRVTKRRKSSAGLAHRPDPLLAVAEDQSEPILNLVAHRDPHARWRVFTTASVPTLDRSAVLCRSELVGRTRPEWPTTWGAALMARSSEDRFRCWNAMKTPQGWAIEPD